MIKTNASSQLVRRMSVEADRLLALSTALDKAIAQFGATRLASCLPFIEVAAE